MLDTTVAGALSSHADRCAAAEGVKRRRSWFGPEALPRARPTLRCSYQRVLILLEPGPTTLPLGGKTCRVHEYEDGQIEVRHAGQLLPCRAFFDKDSCVQPGAIVANKRLDATLARIQEAQQQRDRQRLANPNLTLRQKSRIRAAQERADAPAPAR